MNGYLSAFFDGLLAVVDSAPEGPLDPMSVNLIGDWEHDRSRKIREMLADVGLTVNTSFSVDGHDASTGNIRRLNRAPLSLLADTNFVVAVTAKHLRERFGTRLSEYAFPKGFRETALWLRDIGKFFGSQERVEEYLAAPDSLRTGDHNRVHRWPENAWPCSRRRAGRSTGFST